MSDHLDYEINKELGECYLFMGDMDKAEEYYLKAMGSNGVHCDPYLGLATIAVQRGDLPRAKEMYIKASSIEKSDKSVAGLALVEMEGGELDNAFVHFQEALAMNPENMIALYGMVQTGSTLGRLSDVVPHLVNYLAVDPLKDNVRFTLAGCLVSLGEEDEASRHLERIMENDPEFTPARELYEKLSA
ncbi:MAG: hypothetical protein D6E12_02120 [Desulfovibrio sp.]|nr:MAG: hypothetical protein D6E12_02120 [Desulfovibrio sp.]